MANYPMEGLQQNPQVAPFVFYLVTPAVSPYPAVGRPGYLTRHKHPSLPTSQPQQQVLVLAEPRRKPSNFWQSISRLAPFRK